VIDHQAGTGWAAIAGLLVGCGAGMYETFREALRIEGFDKPRRKDDDRKPE
jgi:F0F1-type ATP synthase assembly protein I